MQVDGNDALALYSTASTAIDRARSGGGPTLIEALTMRMAGHAVHDDAAYVPPGLVRQWQGRDPVERLARQLDLTDAERRAVEAQARANVEAALTAALAAPEPDPATLTDGVYADWAYR